VDAGITVGQGAVKELRAMEIKKTKKTVIIMLISVQQHF